jgi:hypothetical protein
MLADTSHLFSRLLETKPKSYYILVKITTGVGVVLADTSHFFQDFKRQSPYRMTY